MFSSKSTLNSRFNIYTGLIFALLNLSVSRLDNTIHMYCIMPYVVLFTQKMLVDPDSGLWIVMVSVPSDPDPGKADILM